MNILKSYEYFMNRNVSTYIKLWLILFDFIAIYSIGVKRSLNRNAILTSREELSEP